MLKELSNKGGHSDAFNTGNFKERIMASALTHKIGNNNTDDDQIVMNIQQIVPPDGYLPVTLVKRGDYLMEQSYNTYKKHLRGFKKTDTVLKKRPMINPKLDQITDDVFQQVRKRQRLLDNEHVAYAQLKMAVGIRSKGPFQIPLVDEYSDRAYKQLKNQFDELDASKGNAGALAIPVQVAQQGQVPIQPGEQLNLQPVNNVLPPPPPPPPPMHRPPPPPPIQQQQQNMQPYMHIMYDPQLVANIANMQDMMGVMHNAILQNQIQANDAYKEFEQYMQQHGGHLDKLTDMMKKTTQIDLPANAYDGAYQGMYQGIVDAWYRQQPIVNVHQNTASNYVGGIQDASQIPPPQTHIVQPVLQIDYAHLSKSILEQMEQNDMTFKIPDNVKMTRDQTTSLGLDGRPVGNRQYTEEIKEGNPLYDSNVREVVLSSDESGNMSVTGLKYNDGQIGSLRKAKPVVKKSLKNQEKYLKEQWEIFQKSQQENNEYLQVSREEYLERANKLNDEIGKRLSLLDQRDTENTAALQKLADSVAHIQKATTEGQDSVAAMTQGMMKSMEAMQNSEAAQLASRVTDLFKSMMQSVEQFQDRLAILPQKAQEALEEARRQHNEAAQQSFQAIEYQKKLAIQSSEQIEDAFKQMRDSTQKIATEANQEITNQLALQTDAYVGHAAQYFMDARSEFVQRLNQIALGYKQNDSEMAQQLKELTYTMQNFALLNQQTANYQSHHLAITSENTGALVQAFGQAQLQMDQMLYNQGIQLRQQLSMQDDFRIGMNGLAQLHMGIADMLNQQNSYLAYQNNMLINEIKEQSALMAKGFLMNEQYLRGQAMLMSSVSAEILNRLHAGPLGSPQQIVQQLPQIAQNIEKVIDQLPQIQGDNPISFQFDNEEEQKQPSLIGSGVFSKSGTLANSKPVLSSLQTAKLAGHTVTGETTIDQISSAVNKQISPNTTLSDRPVIGDDITDLLGDSLIMKNYKIKDITIENGEKICNEAREQLKTCNEMLARLSQQKASNDIVIHIAYIQKAMKRSMAAVGVVFKAASRGHGQGSTSLQMNAAGIKSKLDKEYAVIGPMLNRLKNDLYGVEDIDTLDSQDIAASLRNAKPRR